MSETADELKNTTVEEQSDTVPEPQTESDAAGQPVQVVAETDGETIDSEGADDNADAKSAVDSIEEVAEEQAAIENANQGAPLETEESREDGASVADFVIVTIFAFILGMLLCLPTFLGSSGSASVKYDLSGGVAASVEGVEIGENDVTAYVTSFRTAQGFEDDNAWGQWMVDAGYTPEALRSDTIEYFVTRELLSQAAKEQGVEVSEADVDKQLASLVEQIGGEEVLTEGLAQQGITMESYRESIAFGLLQEALTDKVTANDEALSDDAVLEMMKMYFPDEVPEDATSLDGLDANLVDNVRMWLKQQAFSSWMDQRRAQADVKINDMPEGLPYAVDLSGYEPTANDLEWLEEAPEVSKEAQGDEGAKS